ncbi:pectin methylesterase [Zunongwangia sp. SCSIO 43204]|uniref:pectinesterase family protein n=1 Tax=Zunongwangia sp. SCSIO 43204 TaxID=2779359 RepID=UPI001CAA1EE8|nr:pectinesterase family protein [Zunongwangia sp. SCSIO 43204]UAB86119.1 pectin methylesterase [Zunongwangia sp. SCSIO 43204]
MEYRKSIKYQPFFILNLLLLFLLSVDSASAQSLAFPGAEGFGRYTKGGRDGIVYKVTNLNDSGEGSLRKGIQKRDPRIIVFEVSGTINLESSLDINRGNLTIAGQTAPEGGITLKGYPVKIKADNVIIQYLRFRMGDINDVEDDAFGGRGNSDIMIDHCSISWATDENSSFYWNKNFTMQWCIISEALNRSVHHKGAHGYGGIWGGENASFHHNLIASNSSRNPRFGGSSSVPNKEDELVDFRNNVIFNWGFNSIYGGEKGRYNVVNNYFKPGPATEDDVKDRILNPSKPYGQFFVEGNYVEGSQTVSRDNWKGGVQCDDPAKTKASEMFDILNNINTEEAYAAYNNVLKQAGASLYRDEVDQRIITEVRSGKTTFKNGIIDSQEDVGGWPNLKNGQSKKDSDGDGMPDEWEKANNLNPNKNDATQYQLSEQYTNLEIYIQELTKSAQYDFIVASDGSGDFKTLTKLINHLPDFRKNETRVFIKNGIYKEKLVLPASKTNIQFIGESKDSTIITYDDYASKLNRFGEGLGTTGSTSFFIFGDDFYAENITFENSAGRVGQAVAVRVDGNNAHFKNCNFLGNQDTLYLHGKNSKQFYENCYIEGTVDFIFGWSSAVFYQCEIKSKRDGYVTAASTEEGAKYGIVFIECDFTAEGVEANSVYLGRPWRNYAQTVLVNCHLGNHIKTEGWHNWGKPEAEETTFYAEYNSTGPGAADDRVNWAKSLSEEQQEYYLILLNKNKQN